jgi:hypothetical protein
VVIELIPVGNDPKDRVVSPVITRLSTFSDGEATASDRVWEPDTVPLSTIVAVGGARALMSVPIAATRSRSLDSSVAIITP